MTQLPIELSERISLRKSEVLEKRTGRVDLVNGIEVLSFKEGGWRAEYYMLLGGKYTKHHVSGYETRQLTLDFVRMRTLHLLDH